MTSLNKQRGGSLERWAVRHQPQREGVSLGPGRGRGFGKSIWTGRVPESRGWCGCMESSEDRLGVPSSLVGPTWQKRGRKKQQLPGSLLGPWGAHTQRPLPSSLSPLSCTRSEAQLMSPFTISALTSQHPVPSPPCLCHSADRHRTSSVTKICPVPSLP